VTDPSTTPDGPRARHGAPRAWVRPLRARDPHEPHRVVTPLELLFDLCFAVAVAQAAARLHHGLGEGHVGPALLGFGVVFFAVWWAWMGFTWFASAYDDDDVAYRVAVFVEIAGALVLAAGIPRAFDETDFRVVTLGYAILRAGLVTLWIRAARADGPGRATAQRYATGLVAVQLGWIALLAAPRAGWVYGWLLLAPLELLVPVWAERRGATPWHPHHIAERFGCMALIVLGESVLSATMAIQSALDVEGLSIPLLETILGGLLIVFGMWWAYFERPAHALLISSRRAFVWGYGHLLIFASTAAVGAGLALQVDADAGPRPPHGAHDLGGWVVGVPVAVYLLALCALQVRPLDGGRRLTVAHGLAAAAALALSPLPGATLWIGFDLVGLAVASARACRDKGRA